jgi:hypothetical protein
MRVVGGDEPACCFALNAMSSSSISPLAAFLGFLLWMGFVPAVASCQLSSDFKVYLTSFA